jgi:hypothetical protein
MPSAVAAAHHAGASTRIAVRFEARHGVPQQSAPIDADHRTAETRVAIGR